MLASHKLGVLPLEEVIKQTLSLLFALGIALMTIGLQQDDT